MKTIEEKAKAYDEAIERAIKHHNNDGLTLEQYETIDIIFPELKESEDERIRKELIEHIKANKWADYVLFQKFSPDDVIAWLEKQSEKSISIDIESMVSSYKQRLESQGNGSMKNNPLVNMCLTAFKHGVEEVLQELNLKEFKKQISIDENKIIKRIKTDIATSLINYIDANSKGMYLSDIECEDIEDAIINNKWYKVYNYMKKELEKQEEKPQGKSALEAIKEEKVDNANKVEPKFCLE